MYQIISLNGPWRLCSERLKGPVPAVVPGSVLTDLAREGVIDNPFYRDNEDIARELSYEDYTYFRSFELPEKVLDADRLELCCDGLDTLAEIRVNDRLIAATDNMHLAYRLDIKPLVTAGENTLEILFRSPSQYIQERQARGDIRFVVDGGMWGNEYIRKAHSAFGWDWGPQMPDAGIWRDIRIEISHTARLGDLRIEQIHKTGAVDVECRVTAEAFTDAELYVEALLTAPDGSEVKRLTVKAEGAGTCFAFTVENPQLWWPNGYGAHPLYTLTVELLSGGESLDRIEKRIGLRTVGISRENDQWGQEFCLMVNGIKLFAMGANYIPEDSLLGRLTPERTRRLLEDAVWANFNTIRVWGGGYYPPDYFYDICDELGLLVWQDFMFACNVYDLTEDFARSIREEAVYQVRRLRHHASLALWCGNNENEMGWADWNFESVSSKKHKEEYLIMFEEILQQVTAEEDGGRFYWPSSPSSGGGFVNTLREDMGDTHYWDVWAQDHPIREYREHFIRFCSEFGFQSFPCLKTVESFTRPEDRNIFTPVMELHQKKGPANAKILQYLIQQYRYPTSFEALLYGSQLMQAEAIRCAAEHFRRHRGRCMGALYWQFNDCWPVASWSSVDYYGRYKALHYMARRFFAPIAISAEDDGPRVRLTAVNETMTDFAGRLSWRLRNPYSRVLQEEACPVSLAPFSSSCFAELDYSDILHSERHIERRLYLDYTLEDMQGETVGEGTVLFCPPKSFEFADPRLYVRVEEREDAYAVTLEAAAFAKSVCLDLRHADGRFSDNWFDLHAGVPKTVLLRKADLSQPLDAAHLRAQLTVLSVYDMDK